MDRTPANGSREPADRVAASRHEPLLPLESGDHLTRAEFERRYEAMPRGIKCELLDGVVYVASPAKHEHGRPDSILAGWLFVYSSETPGTESLTNPTLRLDEVSEPQPDEALRLLPEAGGGSRVDADGYLGGPIELVAEIAASSASHDLHQKRAVYLRNGVRECLVVTVREPFVHWFALEASDYVRLAPDRQGVLRSRTFPGLWLDTRALLAGDGARVLAVLRRGLASPAHATFARELKKRSASRRRRR